MVVIVRLMMEGKVDDGGEVMMEGEVMVRDITNSNKSPHY